LGRGASSFIIAVADLLGVQFERSRIVDVLEHRERLATFGELMAAAAHEMNSPLCYLQSNLTTLERSLKTVELPTDLRDDVRAMIADCMDGTEKLSR
ncbi:hypothetical protein, partial [Flavobacterium hibisci]|uniref:hypothetical protein n=1 Tax=Flavobacterium hibisci TaxID=1914462 RepID=UPI001CBDC23B